MSPFGFLKSEEQWTERALPWSLAFCSAPVLKYEEIKQI